MPRQVDHTERRQRIATAVCELIAARGLENTSMRDVAAEAGISLGQVQHYFASKNEMLHFAFDHINGLATGRVERAIAASDQPDNPRTIAWAVLSQLIPADTEAAQQISVGVAFQARSLVEPELAERLRNDYAKLTQLLALMVTDALSSRAATSAVAPAEAALELLALADGLSSHVLAEHIEANVARGILDQAFDRVFSNDAEGDSVRTSEHP